MKLRRYMVLKNIEIYNMQNWWMGSNNFFSSMYVLLGDMGKKGRLRNDDGCICLCTLPPSNLIIVYGFSLLKLFNKHTYYPCVKKILLCSVSWYTKLCLGILFKVWKHVHNTHTNTLLHLDIIKTFQKLGSSFCYDWT